MKLKKGKSYKTKNVTKALFDCEKIPFKTPMPRSLELLVDVPLGSSGLDPSSSRSRISSVTFSHRVSSVSSSDRLS